MRTFGNIIWHFPFFGFVTAFFTFLVGLLLTATVVAAPVGLGLIELSKLLLAPFGKEMVDSAELNQQENSVWKSYSLVVQIIYVPCIGLWLALLAVIQAGLCFISIIGIPVGIVVAKSLRTYLNPVGKKCVSSAVAAELERQKAQREVGKYFGTTTGAESGSGSAFPATTAANSERTWLPSPKVAGAVVGSLVLLAVVSSFTGNKPKPAAVAAPQAESRVGIDVQPLRTTARTPETPIVAVHAPLPSPTPIVASPPPIEPPSAAPVAVPAVPIVEKPVVAKQMPVERAPEKMRIARAVVPNPPSQASGNSQMQQNGAITSILSDGEECMSKKKFDCAISNAKSALRIDPANGKAQTLKQAAETELKRAMDAISIN